MNTPVNHHYVPQHFLAAWATDSDGKLINRYKRIPHTGEIKFKKAVGIRSVASEDNIYVVTDGTASAEFETSIMTEELDTPTAAILKKLREKGLGALDVGTGNNPTSNELMKLTKYIVALEARHPKTIAKMEISPGDIKDIGTNLPRDVSSTSVNAVVDFVSKLNISTYAAGLIVANDDEFSEALRSSSTLELNFENSALYTSDYPVGRVGRYDRNFLLAIALTPNSAIVFTTNSQLSTIISSLPVLCQAKLVNFLSLGDADEVYTSRDQLDQFVVDNFSWKTGLNETEQKQRLQGFIKELSS